MKHIVAVCLSLACLAACSSLGFGSAPSNYIIFFAEGASVLTPEARVIVDKAATEIKMKNPATVAISTGVATGDNLSLAQPRFEAVQKALVEDGVPQNIIARSAIAEKKDNVTAIANQRAEIQLFMKK
jgi:outer membrane protein OmpA-like peptidoglycan-associated protein